MKTKESRDMRVRHLAITMGVALLTCFLIGCIRMEMESGRGAAPKAARVSTTGMPGKEASVGRITVHRTDAAQSAGTGFLVASNLVVTCLHVVNGARSAVITFPSGLSLPIKGIAAEDAENDLAILTITPTGYEPPPLPFAPVPAQVGDKLDVHGYPVGPSQEVRGGNVTSIGPSWGMPQAIITSAPLTHGFSGGPALNDQRQVVGVAMASVGGVVIEGKEIVKTGAIVVHASRIASLAVGLSRSLKDWTDARGAIASADAEVDCGQLAVEQGDRAKGLQHFQKATQLDPNNFKAWCWLGFSLQEMGRDDQAMDAVGKALTLKPQFPEALVVLARSFVNQRRYPEAIGTLERVLRMDPNSDRVHLLLGLAYALADQSEKAREQYQALKPINPKAAEYLLGVIQKMDAASSSTATRSDLGTEDSGKKVLLLLDQVCYLFERIIDNVKFAAKDGSLNKEMAVVLVKSINRSFFDYPFKKMRDQHVEFFFSCYLNTVSEIHRLATTSLEIKATDRLAIINTSLIGVSELFSLKKLTPSQTERITQMSKNTTTKLLQAEVAAGNDLDLLLGSIPGAECTKLLREMGIYDNTLKSVRTNK